MKLRAILNGITALCAIGAFYTFTFCMVDGIDDTEISREYYYNTAAVDETDENEKEITDTLPGTVNAVKAEFSAGTPFLGGYNKEKMELPDIADDERINDRVGAAYEYMAANTEAAEESAEAKPIYPVHTEAATTSVPEEAAEAEPVTESAAVFSEPEPAEEDLPDDVISSENTLWNETSPVTESEYSPSREEIMDNLRRMQEEAETTSAPEALWGDYYNTDATIIYSQTSFFETVPVTSETTLPETTTTLPVTTTEALPTETTTAAIGSSETLTAKVDGRTQEFNAYDLVCMIVSTEMSPSFSQEALKAQAVAAYSYVKYHNYKGLVPSVLVKRNIPDEVRAAVDSVFGKCCYYNGAPAQTVYTASSAGTTASCTNVWGGKDVPYLRSIDTSFDAQYDPNYGVTQTFSESYIRRALENYCGITLSDNPADWFSIQSRIDGNYVGNVLIDGQTTISGRTIREKVLGFGIKSACFDVSYADGTFTFVTYGYGHGVGMSQNGANILGRQGWTYEQILEFYFPGITIS